jgi:hypothetical protein
MSAPITIRDRRDLPFFMVRLRALQEIRNNISGPRRARALGLYVLLCQIANEQRADCEHLRLVATVRDLTRRGALSPSTLKTLLAALRAAGAARFETRIDPLRGAMPSLIHLDIQDGSWIAITVATADQLATLKRAVLLPTLGLLAVLLELCDEQRQALGGLRAETTRRSVALRLGCSTDTLDGWVRTLEHAGIVAVTRRRGEDGGHLPNLWEITEPTSATEQPQMVPENVAEPQKQPTGKPHTPQPMIRNTLAAEGKQRPLEAETAAPSSASGLAERGKWAPGKAATPATDARPLNARTRNIREEQLPEESLNPQTPNKLAATPQNGGGEGIADDQGTLLCVALVETLADTRGPGPARRYAAAAAAWQAAAARILADHPMEKVLEVIAYLPHDQVIGTKVRGIPDLERHIEDLRHRAHAAKTSLPGRITMSSSGAPAWPEAKALLARAIQRHGGGGKTQALAELDARHPQLRRFVDQVGWGALCQSPFEKQDYAYRTSWDALTRQADAEEAA